MIASSVFLCTIVIHTFVRADTFCSVPCLIELIFINGLARLYCMLPEEVKKKQLTKNIDRFELVETHFKVYRKTAIEVGIENVIIKQNDSCTSAEKTEHENVNTISDQIERLCSLERCIKEIRDYLRETRTKIEYKEHETKMAKEWKLVALVLDRTFFLIFFFITFATILIIFFKFAFE